MTTVQDPQDRGYANAGQQQQQQQQQDSAPDSPAVQTPVTKGKNGATGPAEGKPKPHVCPICQRGFTTGGHLQRHQRIHTGIKAFKCPYPGCETRTSRQDNLQQHYRTHLSPTLRRGSGTAARQAVAAAMMAAGLKSSTSRQPRKSKNSQVGTPGSSSGASVTHGQSPYQTPTQATAPYGGYMYDATGQHGGYPPYGSIPPPGVSMANAQSAQSSRVASPVNGHSSASSVPSAHHQQYFGQPFAQPGGYAYPQYSQSQGGYRYGAPNTMPPYGAPPSQHSMYSGAMAPDHHQQHMYSPVSAGGFSAPHSARDSYGSVMTQGGYASQQAMSNGYPARQQTSTPLSAGAHEDIDPRYRSTGAPRALSPRRSSLTQQGDLLAASSANGTTSSSAQASAGTSTARGTQQLQASAQSYSYAPSAHLYGSAQHSNGMAQPSRDGPSAMSYSARPSVASLTEANGSSSKGEYR